MRVFNDGLNDFTLCDKLQSGPIEEIDEVGIRRPTNSQWRVFFDHPERCPEGETFLRSWLPKNNIRVSGGYRGCNIIVLYFEHSFAVGFLLTITAAATGFALCWAIKRDDISGGFGVGAYVFAFLAFATTLYFKGSVVGSR